jgi:hypothetical protein
MNFSGVRPHCGFHREFFVAPSLWDSHHGHLPFALSLAGLCKTISGRRETYRLLTRPPEADWTTAGMSLNVFYCLLNAQTLWAQISVRFRDFFFVIPLGL